MSKKQHVIEIFTEQFHAIENIVHDASESMNPDYMASVCKILQAYAENIVEEYEFNLRTCKEKEEENE